MYNKAILVGNMGSECKVTETSGGKVGKFSLATNKKVKGEDRTTWHNIVIWDDVKIDYLTKYAGTGAKILVEGEISNRSYEQDGVKKWMSEVIVGRFDSKVQILDSRNSDGSNGGDSDHEAARPVSADLDDSVPF